MKNTQLIKNRFFNVTPLILFFSIFVNSCTPALAADPPVSMKGQSQTAPIRPAWNIVVPYNQATNLGGQQGLVETGNLNILSNPGFEGPTAQTGWTISNGTASNDTTNELTGAQALSVSLSAVNGTVFQQNQTDCGKLGSQNLTASIYCKTSSSNFQACSLVNNAEVACSAINNTDIYAPYLNTMIGVSGQSCGIRVKTIASTTDTIECDEARVGISELSNTVSASAWFVDVNISGTNPSLGTAAVASYTGIENSALTMTLNSGSATAQIGCSSTNPPTGLTCSAGNESVSVAFNPPFSGYFDVCAAFGWLGTVAANGIVNTTFQMIETPINAQTISQEGKDRTGSTIDSTAATQNGTPYLKCGTFLFSDTSQKLVRLMYEQSVAGTVNSVNVLTDGNTGNGQRDVRITVRPVVANVSQLSVNGIVVSNSTGQERLVRARFTSSGNCVLVDQSGTWISSCTRNSGGNYTLNIISGIFSSTPTCVVTPKILIGTSIPNSSTNVTVEVRDYAGTDTDGDFGVICQGPN